MQKRQVETDEPATLRISGNALHLSDGVGVTLLDDQIVLENRATGASTAGPSSREARRSLSTEPSAFCTICWNSMC